MTGFISGYLKGKVAKGLIAPSVAQLAIAAMMPPEPEKIE